MVITHNLKSKIKDLLRFKSINVSILTFISILFVVYKLFLFEQEDLTELTRHSNNELKDLVDYSWGQLQIITEKPHPYSSHFNAEVHDHILSEVTKIVNNENVDISRKITIDSDPRKLLFKQQDVFDPNSKDTIVVSYESDNILVKIQGTNQNLPALLISNHFDSVPIGYGKNDANTGTVTLLALLKQLLRTKDLKRDIIFNFNNNEEFGLLGATAYMQNHPWLKKTGFFLNLEGVSGGGHVGKPILFRTNNVQTASLFKKFVGTKGLAFGNSIFQYGFLSRWLSSETDYKVYEEKLIGWDISFFKNRRFYHTLFDSTKYDTKYGVFSMLQVCSLLVKNMAINEDLVDQDNLENRAVYFDFLGKFYVFGCKKFNELNLVVLILFPILFFISWNVNGLSHELLNWIKPLISIATSTIIMSLSYKTFINNKNPMLVSRSFYIPLLALISEFLLINTILIRTVFKGCYRFKSIATMEITFGLWLILLSKTVKNIESGFLGTYIYVITAMYFAFSISTLMGILFDPTKRVESTKESDDETEVLVNVTSESGQNSTSNYNSIEQENEHDDINNDDYLHQDDEDEEFINKTNAPIFGNWWIQYLITVPVLTLFVAYSSVLVLTALHQSVTESYKSLKQVTSIILYFAFAISLPIVPFIPKLNYYFTFLFLGVFIITSYLSMNLDPFTEQTPIKFRVVEQYDLNYGEPIQKMLASGINIDKYYKSSKPDMLLSNMIKDLPSQKSENFNSTLLNDVECTTTSSGYQTCEWYVPNPDQSKVANPQFDVEIVKNNRLDGSRTVYEPIKATFKIKNIENRLCYLSFPLKNSIKQIEIGDDLKWVKPLDYGVDQLQLHKLNFKEEFEVKLTWIPKLLLENNSEGDDDEHLDELPVNINCFFGDLTYNDTYQSEGIKELLQYGNKNFVVSNLKQGVIVSEKRVVL